MSRWLALGEPIVRVTVRLPRIKSKDERLRERATAYVESTYVKAAASFATDDPWRYEERVRMWTHIRLNERKAIIAKFPRRWRKRACEHYEVPKWW